MKVFLIDGTYELFRQYYGRPGHQSEALGEVDAVRGVLGMVVGLLETGATHVAVATDHVIESFRNALWAGYKTGEGIDPILKAQFAVLEEALVAMGVATYPMVDLEADDGLASAAWTASRDDRVDQVAILSPDKDLAQCVVGAKVVQVDQRRSIVYDEAGVQAKFGVLPASIPDYLALVGDSADGYPGISGFGAKGTAAILSEYGTIENIPIDGSPWKVNVRGSASLAAKLADQIDNALLFKHLATLRIDETLVGSVDELEYRGPKGSFAEVVEKIDGQRIHDRLSQLIR